MQAGLPSDCAKSDLVQSESPVSAAAGNGATIVPFPVPSWGPRRLSPQDRAEAFAWERVMCRTGYAQVSLEEAEGSRSADRLIVYHGEELWIAQGVARPARRFGLWHCASGVKVGDFVSVWTALEAIPLGLARSAPALQGAGWMPQRAASF